MTGNYTRDQQKAIDLQGKNILVSAAAGSGKTAVLVERIVKKIAEGDSPLDIDRLLVVTFTNAAAAEMRERIGGAIGKRLEKEAENEHLQRQMTLIHNAQITTTHSFCLFLLRNHFSSIGLDPGFRIADEGELKLLGKEVMEGLLEAWYEKKEAGFLACVDYFVTGSKDQLLEEYITKLYFFAMSFPWPEEWLQERKQDYGVADVKDVEDSSWGDYLLRFAGAVLEGCGEEMEQCIRICAQADGPYMYEEVLEKELHMLSNAKRAKNLEEIFALWKEILFGRLPSRKDETVSAEKREQVQEKRNRVKGMIKEMGERFFYRDILQEAEHMAVIKKALDVLVDLTLDYKRRLDAAKREKNIIDFGDMEHFALSILLEKKEGGFVPTEAARELQEYFAEILIDEYQDSNMVQELLLRSISREDRGEGNRFMVGDVKQSIYKFRLARPEIFMEKYDRYRLETGEEEGEAEETGQIADCRRIDLRKNFRSRKEVLDSVNYVFERIMQKAIGGVAYDQYAALYLGGSFPEKPADSLGENKTELLLLDLSGEEAKASLPEGSPKEWEARMIAGRIRELVGSFPVTDSRTGKLRPAGFRDMVILLRTNAEWDEVFKKVLEEEGIPTYISTKTGYFETMEIRTVLHIMRILDNPLQDIPLFGVMKSWFGGFNEEEIAGIQAAYREKIPFYQKILQWLEDRQGTRTACGEAKGGDLLEEKVAGFLAWLKAFREKSIYVPIQDLLRELMIDSGYYHYIAVLPAGEQRLANLKMLLSKAASFAETSYYGLFHFVRYIEQLEKYDVDYGEANILDEQADVVRLMSIHKSKGLEFPICFVAGLGKGFHMRDAYSGMIAEVEMGIGVDYVNPGLRMQRQSMRKSIISQKMKLDSLGEELRVLYVAMTRAKEKLILSGGVKKWETFPESGRGLSFLQGIGAGSYLDLLLPVIMGEGAEVYFDTRIAPPDRLFSEEVKEKVEQKIRREELKAASLDPGKDSLGEREGYMTMMSEKFARKYERTDLAALYTKTTVSELKKGSQKTFLAPEEKENVFEKPLFEEPEIVPYIPSFIKDREDMTGTVRGSAYHKVMELICFRAFSELPETAAGEIQSREQQIKILVERQIERAYGEGKLSEAYKEAVNLTKILHFMQTPLADRMIAADLGETLYKEQPFVMGLTADRLGQEFSAEETILIQGIMDVFFEEEGQLVVMDYKTDAVSSQEELIQRYGVQLQYYEEALEQLTGKKVKEKIIYSFALNRAIHLKK